MLGIIIGKIFNASTWLNYNLTEGILRYKNIIVIGKDRELRNRLVSFAHGFYIKYIHEFKILIKYFKKCFIANQ